MIRRTSLSHRLKTGLALGAVLALAVGCTPHRDEVTFYGNRTAVNVGPAYWCDVDYSSDRGDCDNPGELAELDLRPGDALQISVSPGIADQGWMVVYGVETSPGADPDIRRTPLLAEGELAQVIRVEPTERIVSADVQAQFLQIAADAEGTSADYQPAKIWMMVSPSS